MRPGVKTLFQALPQREENSQVFQQVNQQFLDFAWLQSQGITQLPLWLDQEWGKHQEDPSRHTVQLFC